MRFTILVSCIIGIVGSLLFTLGISQGATCPTLNIFRIDTHIFQFLYRFKVHVISLVGVSNRLLLIFCGRS